MLDAEIWLEYCVGSVLTLHCVLLVLVSTQVDKVMAEIDTNNNGYIELNEFIAWCAKTM